MNHTILAATTAMDSNDGMNAGILLLRVVIGLTLAAHGLNKFFGGGKIPGTARWFDSMGMKPNGKIHALAAASTETGAGLLFAVGLITPVAAAGIVGLMIVAAWTVHRANGFFIVKEGLEYNLILATVAVAVAATGPGRYSFDNIFNLESLSFHPKLGVAIAVGVGVVSAAALIACCYRPPAPSESASES